MHSTKNTEDLDLSVSSTSSTKSKSATLKPQINPKENSQLPSFLEARRISLSPSLNSIESGKPEDNTKPDSGNPLDNIESNSSNIKLNLQENTSKNPEETKIKTNFGRVRIDEKQNIKFGDQTIGLLSYVEKDEKKFPKIHINIPHKTNSKDRIAAKNMGDVINLIGYYAGSLDSDGTPIFSATPQVITLKVSEMSENKMNALFNGLNDKKVKISTVDLEDYKTHGASSDRTTILPSVTNYLTGANQKTLTFLNVGKNFDTVAINSQKEAGKAKEQSSNIMVVKNSCENLILLTMEGETKFDRRPKSPIHTLDKQVNELRIALTATNQEMEKMREEFERELQGLRKEISELKDLGSIDVSSRKDHGKRSPSSTPSRSTSEKLVVPEQQQTTSIN